MGSGGLGLVERRSRVRAALEAMAGFEEVLAQASDAELAEVMGEADGVAARAAAVRAAVTVEAVKRGVPAAAGVNVHGWVRDHAPSLRQGGSGQVARLAVEVAQACRAGGSLAPDAAGVPDPGSPLGLVWAGVVDGSVSAGLAVAVLGEVERLRPRLVEEVLPTATAGLLDLGVVWGPTQMRRLRPRLLAEYGHRGEFDDLQQRLARAARLSSPRVESADLTAYELVVTPEQAGVLEAAIGVLSAPVPNEVTGERDLRPAGQRRVEALAEVCRRSAAVDADRAGGADGAAGSAAALHVTMGLSELQERTGVGEVLGSTATGVLLSPEVVRRVACDAALVPHVLGSAGEPLDVGRVVRLFTPAQRRHLWNRDLGCTFPGCTAPASWARAHHVVHWADGGASDVDNAALLCQRHHTVVHERRLWARVRGRPDERGRSVVWDLTEGSYDRHLADLERHRAAHDPPPLTRRRVLELVADLTGGDEAERRLAEHDLTLAATEHHLAALRAEQMDDHERQAWLRELEALDADSAVGDREVAGEGAAGLGSA